MCLCLRAQRSSFHYKRAFVSIARVGRLRRGVHFHDAVLSSVYIHIQAKIEEMLMMHRQQVRLHEMAVCHIRGRIMQFGSQINALGFHDPSE